MTVTDDEETMQQRWDYDESFYAESDSAVGGQDAGKRQSPSWPLTDPPVTSA